MSEHFVIALAFFASVAVLFRPVVKFLRSSLFSYSRKISDELDSSLDKKDKLYSLMVSYLEKNKSLNAEAAAIVSEARDRSEQMKDAFVKDIEAVFNQKVDYMVNVFSNNIKMAVEEIKLSSVRVATEAVKHFVEESSSQDKERQGEVCLDFASELGGKKFH